MGIPWWGWLIIIGTVIGVVYIIMNRAKLKRPYKGDERGEDYEFGKTVWLYQKGHTPAGSAVFSYQNPSPQAREMADTGIAKAMNLARQRGWTHGLDPKDYQISFWPPAPNQSPPAFEIESYVVNKGLLLDENGQPITVPGYDQGPYDANPLPGRIRLYVAGKFNITPKNNTPGTVFNTSHPEEWIMRLSVVNEPSMTEIAAYNEAEHALALCNDIQLFFDTYGPNHSHPILAPAMGLVGLRSSGFKCG